MKTRQCDECSYFGYMADNMADNMGVAVFLCGHKPKFYNQKNANDDNYGFKRKCGDFKARKGEK